MRSALCERTPNTGDVVRDDFVRRPHRRATLSLSQPTTPQNAPWLEQLFAVSHDGPTVAITRFAPTRGSIAAQFAGSPLKACFVSNLEGHIRRWRPALWLHGHVHDSFDYRIGNTRVFANPRGCAPNRVVERKAFDPSLVIEVG